MRSSLNPAKDPRCRGADVRLICRSSKPLRWYGVEVCRVSAQVSSSSLRLKNIGFVANNPRVASDFIKGETLGKSIPALYQLKNNTNMTIIPLKKRYA
ncbi:hypothetical protein TNCV_545881 [Trichonephila clavipes]|nr:hypothetical protein TNCV_545881 [Trichonephila clavipes]